MNHGRSTGSEQITHDDPRWHDMYNTSPDAHFFQSPDWSRILCTHLPRFSPRHLLFSANGTPCILPLLQTSHCTGLLASLISLPFGTKGGVLSPSPIPPPDYPAILSPLRHINTLKCVVVADRECTAEQVYGATKTSNIKAVMLLDLPYSQIETDRFSANKRKLVHRGRNRGVTVSCTKDDAVCQEYIDLQQRTQNEKGWKATFGVDFMRDVLALDESSLFTAWHQGRMSCGILCFEHNRLATAWQGILDRSNKEALHAQAMNLLYASVFEHYSNHGYHEVDLGASLGIESLEQFKSGFGCTFRESFIYSWLHPLYAPYFRYSERKIASKRTVPTTDQPMGLQ